MFNSNKLNKLKDDYFFNGFVLLTEYRKYLKNFLNLINQLNQDKSLFEIKKKNVSTMTLKQSLLHQEQLFDLNNVLKNLNILDLTNTITCRDLYQTNFIHFLTKGKTPSLPWHRDTYKAFRKTVGSVPSATKIAIYSSVVTPRTAPMQLIAGSHRFDFRNRFFDRIHPYLTFNKFSVVANPGDIIIFDSSILHRRAASRKNAIRSATIYGLLPKIN
tara:strand:- start:6 stop:653 length:648 start_codon:yes stop_codon:yes gene_type:complete